MSQTENGKAFEYACLLSLFNSLSRDNTVSICESSQLQTAKKFFNNLPNDTQEKLVLAANAAARTIIRLEPQLEYEQKNKPLFISIQTDSEGMKGDVRDIICIRKQNHWEIGISCKYNHHAVKHSRLSATIDFGNEWMGIPCSSAYFLKIRPLFASLDAIRKKSKEEGKPALWAEIKGKAEIYYKPLLLSFIDELQRICNSDIEAPKRLVQYLLGKYDFYKVISDESHRTTRVEAININGTLNKPSAGHKSIADVSRIKLPTQIYHLGFKPNSDNTVILVFNEGWEISMRIHNASSLVEPSLKFDVQLISLPSSIYAQVEPWG